MIEIFVSLIFLMLLPSEKKKKKDPDEYYPYMYDHFNNDGYDGDYDGEN